MIILTGGAGFIGSVFLRHLNDRGFSNILVVDHLGQSEKWKNLRNRVFHDYVPKQNFYELIARDGLPAGIRAIVHLGACSSTTEKNADYVMQTNYHASRLLGEYAIKKKIRFIYASSGATYGAGENGFSDDDNVSLNLSPLNIYGYSKQLFDTWAIRTGAMKNFAGLKFFNVYGPNEYHKGDMRSVVHKAFEQIQSTGTVKLFKSYRPEYKDGEQKRDFIYVKDCCDALYWLLENQTCGLYNLGTSQARTWNDLVTAVFDALGKTPKIEYTEIPENLRGQYQYFTEAPISKLRTAGYTKDFTSLEDGVKNYVTNYLCT